jgi:hypothetical protein
LFNSGRSNSASSCSGSLDWKLETGIKTTTPVIDSNGTIYFGNLSSNFYAVNPDGTIKWSYPVYTFGRSAAISSDGTIIVAGSESYLYALNPNGSLKWRTKLSDNNAALAYSIPTIGPDGTIYCGLEYQNNYGELVAINPNGSVKWTYAAMARVRGCPAIGTDGTIYISTTGEYSVGNANLGGVHAVSPNGTKKWVFNNSYYDQYGSPSIGQDGTVYVASSNGIYAISPSGAQLWTYGDVFNFDCSKTNVTPAISSDGSIIVVGVTGQDQNTLKRIGGVVCLNPNGSLRWKYQTEGEGSGSTASAVIDSLGNIYVSGLSTYTYNMYSLSPNGNLRWVYNCGNGTIATLSKDGHLYFSDDARFFSLR